MQYLGAQKWQNDLYFQGKSFNTTVIQVYAPITNVQKLKFNGSMMIYKTF